MESHASLISFDFLRRVWGDGYATYCQSGEDARLLDTLRTWEGRSKKNETSDEVAFIKHFFVKVWGYRLNGEGEGYTIHPKHTVSQGSAPGNVGIADAALGWFDHPTIPSVPIALCEFKDIHSNLDAPQKRKNDKRSPVKQCAEYLREAARESYGNERFQPLWGFVSDMNEFRLYWRNTIPNQCQRFVLERTGLEPAHDLLRSKARKAKTTICRLVLSLRSQFFQSLRHFSSQPNERSTTQRLGMTANVCSSLRLATLTVVPSVSRTPVAKGSPV